MELLSMEPDDPQTITDLQYNKLLTEPFDSQISHDFRPNFRIMPY